MLNLFKKDDKRIKGEVVDLIERYRVSEKSSFDGVPTIYYNIFLNGSRHRVGKCDLRLKNDGFMYYYGNIGYNILEDERGHHYAYYATKILLKIAKEEFGLNELIVTCDPGNDASYKTLKKLKGELIQVAAIPYDHELYQKGDRFKCIFRFKM